MSNALRQPMTMAEFLEWEARQPAKHEFDGEHPVALAGSTRTHSQLQRNLAISIGGALRGGPCEFLGSDFQFRLGATVRYPDGVVSCGERNGRDVGASDAVVVFEVLSPSTAGVDRIVKNHEYQAAPSVQRYVMLEQDRIAATVFARAGEAWSGQLLGPGDALDMPEIGLRVPLDDLYLGIDLAGMQEG